VTTPILNVFRPGVHRLCRLYFGIEFHGVGNIPLDGGVIIAPNHQTYADPPLVTIPVRRPIYYMAWRRLFDVPVFGWFIRLLRAFPVDVDSADRTALREAQRLLRGGQAVMIFPEGGRSEDGRLQAFKMGAFRLAVSVQVPVLPVTISGGHRAWPPTRRWPRPTARLSITYHPLVHPVPALGPRDAARDLARRTHAAIISALE
jgi:1-acyl-sn-glycerol-3-phosphate acyltransferase